MKYPYVLFLLPLILIAGCDGKPEGTVHVEGKIDVTVKEETQKQPARFFGGNPSGTIVGDEKKFDSRDF